MTRLLNSFPTPLLLALILDGLFGEPPDRYHPVAWMGKLIAGFERMNENRNPLASLLWGTLLVLGGGGLVAWISVVLARFVSRLPPPLNWVGEAVILKSTFSIHALHQAAASVRLSLLAGDLPGARRLLGWHLVSRDTSNLNSSQVAAAAIESVAENTSDGFVAPLFYYSLAGLPAALVYRFINTADSMLGYRDRDHEWLGKVPARLDDLLNFIPARLTGALYALAAEIYCRNGSQAWRIMRRDARKTQSPNAGYPMSSMAGALGVVLAKEGVYRLGGDCLPAEPAHIARANHLLVHVSAMATLLAWLFPILFHLLNSFRSTRDINRR